MRKLIYMAGLLFSLTTVHAQEYQKVWDFIHRYERSRNNFEIIGQRLPEFKFDKKLNTKALKGKFFVLDFWATWCTPCRYATHWIDSAFFSTDKYRNIQFIGVNHKERNLKKAQAYWEQKEYHFPFIHGAIADSLARRVNAGHPTIMLVDDQGIVRACWRSFFPTSIEFLKLAIFALNTVPEQQLDIKIENIKEMIERQEWPSALYFLEQLPEDKVTSLFRVQCLMPLSEWETHLYITHLKEIFTGKKEYAEVMNGVADALLNSSTACVFLLKDGMEIAEELAYQYNPDRNFHAYLRLGKLRERYGTSLQNMGRKEIENLKNSSK